jgi:predicted tellurium resistance membrane protein TerC
MSPKLWVIITGGLLGILAMRMVIGQLLAIVRRYPALVDGAFVIIAWVGIKLLIEVRAQPGMDPFPGAEMAVAWLDRRHLHGVLAVRTQAGAARRCRRDR